MRTHLVFPCLLLAALACCGCSLLGLDEIDTVECMHDNSVCDPLNVGRENECMLYQCHPSGRGCALAPADYDGDGVLARACSDRAPAGTPLDCNDRELDRTPGRAEARDGIDNDCDEIIDEDVPPQEATELFAVDPGAGEVRSASYAEHDDALWVSYAGSPGGAVHQVGPQLDDMTPVELDPKCEQPHLCNLAQLALVSCKSQLLWTAIDQESCNHGRLRVGLFANGGALDPDDPLPFPPSGCKVTHDVYDLDSEGPLPCSGASRGDGPRGVTGLAAAGQQVLTDGQALLAWIGDSAKTRSACGGEAAGIEAAGLWLSAEHGDQLIAAPPPPRVLGRTLGGGAPAVAAWRGEERGYFIAHGDEQGDVALHFIATLPPVEQCGVEPLPLDVHTLDPIAADGADHVALALGRLGHVCGDADIELGIAWQEGCGRAHGRVRFVQAGFDRERGELCLASDPVTVVEGDASDAQLQPVLIHVPDGFVTPDYGSDSDARGGFLIAWVESIDGHGTARAQRIAADGQPLGTPFKISNAPELGTPRFLTLTTLGERLRAVFLADDDGAFYQVPLDAPPNE